MCTASVYKGQLAVLVQALRAADALGVLPFVLADLGELGRLRPRRRSLAR